MARVGAKLLLGPYGDETFEAVAGDSREALGARGKFSVSRLKFGICHSWPNFLIHFFGQSACCHIKASTFSGRL